MIFHILKNDLQSLTKTLAMKEQSSVNSVLLKEWILNNVSAEVAEAELQQKGFDTESILLHLKELKKQLQVKRQFKGFILMAVGAFMGFVSCVLTLTEVFPDWYGPILYGLTFIGVSIVCVGMYFVFEG